MTPYNDTKPQWIKDNLAHKGITQLKDWASHIERPLPAYCITTIGIDTGNSEFKLLRILQ